MDCKEKWGADELQRVQQMQTEYTEEMKADAVLWSEDDHLSSGGI